MGVDNVISIISLCIAVQVTFLAILLPLFYSAMGELINSISKVPPNVREVMKRYFYAGDTLINLAAVFWSSSILISVSLTGRILTSITDVYIKPLFVLFGLIGIFGMPIFSWMVIYKNYEARSKRRLNPFCVSHPDCGKDESRTIGFILTTLSILIPFLVSIGVIINYPLVTRPTLVTLGRVATIVLSITSLATFPIIGWIVIGWIYEPYSKIASR